MYRSRMRRYELCGKNYMISRLALNLTQINFIGFSSFLQIAMAVHRKMSPVA
jgi:hypothetical protein